MTAVLVLVAMAIFSAMVVALVRNGAIQQLDRQLSDAAHQPGLLTLGETGDDGSANHRGPTDYFVAVIAGDTMYISSTPTTAGGQMPAVPAPTNLVAGQPLTVPSADGAELAWRLVAYNTSNDTSVLIVALPMDPVNQTTASMLRAMLLVGVAVVVVATLAGYLSVQRSLRPLRDIESTARAVADGDFSQRAPLPPASTEIGQLGRSFNTMVSELEEAFAAREASQQRMRRFVSDASHELRTPLASIRGYGELYRMGAVAPDEVPGTFNRIESEATRMGGLVNDLLTLARLDEGATLTISEVDLTAIAADAIADLGALDPSRSAQVISEGPVLVAADNDRIRQVVVNLIGNAVQHTPAGTAVEIAVRAEDCGERSWAVLEVRDHGSGISETDAARMFERFYRPDTSRTRQSGGSGLGLAIVATIIAAHGGKVGHQPTAGGGATIVVRLPIIGPAHPDRHT
ncbi:MAG: sensor histidine kinase [Beutenbergiaceae bacterium]